MASEVPAAFSSCPLTGRYAESNRWENLGGPGDSRPTGLQILQDENLVGGLADKVTLITGVSSGMGPSIVRAMAASGATVFATARKLDQARDHLADVLETGKVHLLYIEQTDLATVRECAAEVLRRTDRLNFMINNAAVMKTPEGARTKDGFELQFGTNHLSHFLLFYLLKDLMSSSATAEFPSRVVNVSSTGHRYGPMHLDNLLMEGIYNDWAAYGQSKTANIYMTTHLDRLYSSQNLRGFAVSPGSFVSPNLQQNCRDAIVEAEKTEAFQRYAYSREQAAANAIYGAVSTELRGKGGMYLEGCAVAGPADEGEEHPLRYGYGSWAFDREKEEKLWEMSKEMVGV